MSSQVMLMFLLTFVTLFEYNHNIRKFNQSTSSITSAHHDLLKFMTNYIKSKSHQHNYMLPLGVAPSRRPLRMVGVGVLIKKKILMYILKAIRPKHDYNACATIYTVSRCRISIQLTESNGMWWHCCCCSKCVTKMRAPQFIMINIIV